MEQTLKFAHPRDDDVAGGANSSAPVPPPPDSLEEAGLSEEFVAGLVVKALHHRGAASGFDLSDILALPFALLDDVIEQLQERRCLQVLTTKGPRRGEYIFELTSAGRKRAAEELELCRYVGPAPVSLDDFRRWVELQTIERTRISEPELQRALDGLVLPDSMLDLLGPAINSGRSLFLYGESGNGKSLLAKRLAGVFGERYYVPHCVLVDGSVMIVYDPTHHGYGLADDGSSAPGAEATEVDAVAAMDEVDAGIDSAIVADRLDDPSPPPSRPSGDMLQEILRTVPTHDRRYAEARRPVVVTGGELTLEQLDLQWDSTRRMYQAPPQLKASGGVLVVDDLGRQRVQVRDLLNRWGVPLEHRQDHLSLGSGRKIVVPFDCFVIFSTNLEPRSLADDAFLRRIHYKIHIPDPGREEYGRIFRSCCEERGIEFDEGALDYLFDEFYGKGVIEPRACHPRDVIDHVRDLAEYLGEPPRLDSKLLEPACRSYFLPSG
jgi:energy-coupling factor transporter ATP-binding protein EcfA2